MWRSNKSTKSLALKIAYVVEEDNGRFHAFAPALKGLHVDGDTKQEAIDNLVEAIPVYISSLAEHDEPLPVGPYLRVHEEPEIPQGAFLGSLTLQWPSLQTSGIS
jgi:predicted RNase H-like HicB family nuclease